jgi:NADPH-dependent 2,4-dienoyl-CoA reductase/sulfur reductase-like enzyme/nitrite reductase/ring-hydroxylating ferredoxin subunit
MAEVDMSEAAELKGPDLKLGVADAELGDGAVLLGHADGEAVLLARRGGEIFAVGATCTHYSGPLAEGLFVGDTLRCPWHHACFSLKTGEALRAPALNPIPCWTVERRQSKLYVIGKAPAAAKKTAPSNAPERIVILGGGAAGHAAAEMLRREGFAGTLTMLSADDAPPTDRPNLSKDYLAGNAPEEWIPLRPMEFFTEQRIDLVLGAKAASIDVAGKKVVLDGGKAHPYDKLLLATGAVPVKLSIPGSELPHVHVLRTLSDSRSIIAKAVKIKRAVVIGASFIGLEVAASLRARNIEVHVVAPEERPLEKVMGPSVGDFIRALHEEHGVVFHLKQTVTSIDAKAVTLASGEVLPAELVVVGIGVKPAIELAEKAGLTIDRGITVDAHLRTSAADIFAAGDIARWPDPHSGQNIRVEHWVVAERHGQIAAKNMLGQSVPCEIVPFFWSQHYDVQISYVGHAERWDRIDVDGSIAAKDCKLTFRAGEKALAVVTIGRDKESLVAEQVLEATR